MNFTDSDGLLVSVPESQVEVVENNPNYTVYQARKNPGGEVLMNVRYNDGEHHMGDLEEDTQDTMLLSGKAQKNKRKSIQTPRNFLLGEILNYSVLFLVVRPQKGNFLP